MSANSRLTVAVHALTWLALAHQRGNPTLSSERVAASIATNAVVVRKALGNLRDAGIVAVEHGRGGGWRLARPAAEITLSDVRVALREGPLFALHSNPPNRACPVGRGIGETLSDIYGSVDESVSRALAAHTIADVLDSTVPGDERVDTPTAALT